MHTRPLSILATAVILAAKPATAALATAGGASAPHDLSPWGMFLAAGIVVKGVMVVLAAASVLVWSVWLAKLVELTLGRRSLEHDIAELELAHRSLTEAFVAAGKRRGLVPELVRVAQREVDLSTGAADAAGLIARISSRIADVEADAIRAVRWGMGFIATVGATAPFIGLFGTVWGIMNSFIGIARTQTSNLSVVAPGIAEALLATAIGLVAAIPAVILYNQLSRKIASTRALLRRAASSVLRLASREADGVRTYRSASSGSPAGAVYPRLAGAAE